MSKRSSALRNAVLTAVLCACPSQAIVVSGTDPSSANINYGVPFDGISLDGVVTITSSIGGCSGTLLSDGMSILTAGHCVAASADATVASGINVTFNGASGSVSLGVASVAVNPGWTGDASRGGDLAVLVLNSPPPAFATRYDLFTGATPFNSQLVIAGYGLGGTGDTGETVGYGTLRAGINEYAIDGSDSRIGWAPGILIGQFYDPLNPLTNALNLGSPYASSDQVDIAHGDSGGPSFYNGQIIGVHDVLICFDNTDGSGCAVPPSVNEANNSYFGQLFGDTSVAAYSSWIAAQETPEPGSGILLAGALALLGFGFRRC